MYVIYCAICQSFKVNTPAHAKICSKKEEILIKENAVMAKMASGELSLTSMSSQEEESSEYAGYEHTLRPPSNSSGNASVPTMANTNANNSLNNNVNSNVKKLDAMKTKYDSAVLELTKLRLQHSDTMRRCDELESQLSFYQEQYCAAMNQLKSADRNQLADIISENERLKQLERKIQANNNANYYCGYNDVAGSNRNSNKCDGSCSEAEKLSAIITAEREKYKNSLKGAFMELESLKKDRFSLRDENQKLKALLAKETKNVMIITEELNQLLSEKDNVLQEHQKMSDDLSVANKELEKLKKDELIYKNEIKALQQANSELKKRDLLKSRESSWSKEFSESKDDFKEIEKLRKSLEKAQLEVERAVQDTEEAKRVRDWAIAQREKIVQERDSVKTLCDNLRKERDKAISELLSAIRDSEKIKKQKDEAQKKIDVLKEQIENQNMDNSSRRSFRMSTYEAEDMLDIELCNYHADSDLGIILDDTNNRQLVCGVTNSSPAFGKLKINDVICKVNNMECQSLSKRRVLDEIRASAPRCNLLVSRTRHSKRHFYTVHLNVQDNRNHGLHVDSGVFISKIEQNSLAAFEPELDVGDRVLSINNKSMEGMQSIDDVMQLLNDERNETITIFALKNVQDISLVEGQRRMTTSSAQTDSVDSMNRITNAKHPSKIAEMLSKFKEKMHISKPITDADQEDAIAALDSVLSENSNERGKRSKRGKKEKESASKSMGTWPRTTFLQTTHENPTGTIVQRDKKRAPLSLFTPINADKDDDRDASDEMPPPLPPQNKALLATLRLGNTNAIKTNPNRKSNPITPSVLFQPQNNNLTSAVGNNNGNPYPNYTRHSVYVGPTPMEQEPLVLEQTKPLQRTTGPIPQMRAKIPNTDKYGQRASNYQNRYSWNITPTEIYKTSGQQAQQQVINNNNDLLGRKHLMDLIQNNQNATLQMKQNAPSSLFVPVHPHNNTFGRNVTTNQQNSLDMISLKSQNSFDSILSTKSPPISEYASTNYAKRGIPMPQAATSAVKNVAKYPSDSESIASGIIGSGGVNSVIGGHFHASNNNRHTQLFPTFTQNTTHPHSHAMRQIRHSSPLTLPSPPPILMHNPNQSHPIDTITSNAIGIPTSSVDKFDLDYVSPAHNHGGYLQDYTHSTAGANPQSSHSHYHPHTSVQGAVIYEGGTFPRKKDLRLRIPSNQSVASKNSGVKNSSSSIDHYTGLPSNAVQNMSTSLTHHQTTALVNSNAANGGGGSGRGSPMPQVHVEVLSHGGSKRNSNVPSDFLCPGDLRRVTIEKSDKSLGITIQCNNNGGGIFVSTVADKSIATRAGLQVGDQLLEVCGLNMRSATNDIAANVLRQCGNSITMLVQYNPEKFHSAEYDGTNNLEPESPVNHSGSPTPRNSPRPPVRNTLASLPPLPMSSSATNPHAATALIPQMTNNSLLSTQSKRSKDQSSFADSLENQSDISSSQDIPSSAATNTAATASTTSTVYDDDSHVRYVTMRMDKSKNLGIKLFGGNKVGIFVHEVTPGSPSDHAGIRKGDQILEYNDVDLRCVTAEQAANEISKLTDTVTMLVQNKLKKLKQIKDKTGDSFYIRVGFDRTGDLNEDDLRFVKDEVLYVDNTVFNGQFGLWRAWKLDAKGHRLECGVIPSQMKVEEELRSGEVIDCESGTARRGSTSARRSFFRRKKHQRSSSRDSTEIASFSNTQLSFFPDAGILNDDSGLLSYQRVEPVDSPVRRPVLIIGPLSEYVMDRLTLDFSNLFKLCEVTSMDCSQEAMEEGLQENIFVDYRRRGNKFECTTVEAISNACKNDRRHCILDISISAVERLQRLQIYPIVLLLRFKSAKQIREIRDFGTDKISAKAAKEMYERALKLETDYKQYISAVIPGVSIKHMCTQIKDSVDKEQDKLLWVPVNN